MADTARSAADGRTGVLAGATQRGVDRLLHFLIAASLGGFTGSLFFGRFPRDPALGLVAFGLTAGLRLLRPRLGPEKTALATVLIVQGFSLGVVVSGQGIQDPTFLLYPAGIVIAAALLPPRWYGLSSGAVIVQALAVGLLQMQRPGTLWLETHVMNGLDAMLPAIYLASCVGAAWVLVLDRRRAEDKLAHAEADRQLVFDSLHDATFVTDATGRILEVNATAVAMFGVRAESLVGRALVDLAAEAPGRTLLLTEPLLAAAAAGRPQVVDWYARGEGRPPFRAELSLRGLPLGGEVRLLAMVRDIEERKRLEAAVRRGEKLDAIGQLAGGVAHDFNNQLAAILGHAEAIRDATAGTLVSTQAEEIVRCVDRGTVLTRRLLAFARHNELADQRFDVGASLDSVVGLLERSVGRRIEVVRDFDTRPLWVVGDLSQVEQGLLGLGLNARDAMPTGGRLTYSASLKSSGAGPRVVVSVEDTGTGMADDVRAHLFEPFFTTKELGRGLGLAALYGTVQRMGGRIDVRSTPGAGTRFDLEFPAAPADAVEPAAPAPVAPRAGARILVVDDEPLVANAAKLLLEAGGFQVECFLDGHAALAAVSGRTAEFSLALVDLAMPAVMGDEVTRQLVGLDPALPVVLMSGYDADGTARQAVSSGARTLLQKPFGARQLLKTVDAHRRPVAPAVQA